MSSRHRYMIFVAAAAALAISLGCSFSSFGLDTVRVGDLESESVTIEREGAESVRVTLKMGAGELSVDKGAEELMEGDFTYNVSDWKPEVDYAVTDGLGQLTIRQRSDKLSIGSDARNTWDLRFNDEIPLDMRIECGAGEPDIDLAGLNITELSVKLGAGSTHVNISDNPGLSRVDLDMGVGSADIDLSGPWTQDAEVTIQGGIGSMTLRLPSDVGVRVDTTRGLGDLETSGLYREDGSWVNEAYGETDVTLEISIQTGIGQVVLDVQR